MAPISGLLFRDADRVGIPLVNGDAAAAAGSGLFAFGFRISLLPRFCPLAKLGFP